MRKLLTIAGCAALMACASHAGGLYVPFVVSVGTNATATVTQSKPVLGYIEEVYVENPSASGVTSAVWFAIAPAAGTNLTETVIYTNATQSASVMARPRVTQTDNTGGNLSSLTVAERFLCVGDSATFGVTQSTSTTGLTFKAWLKISQ